MKRLLPVLCFLIFLSATVYAQDCNSHFEVNAGPDIDVCESGSVGLHGIIGGGATQVIWRGGKGSFVPNRNSLETEYTPAPEELDKGIVLTLVASNPKLPLCPAVRNEIKLRVNSSPKAEAGPSQHMCAGNKVYLKGIVTGKAKQITWIPSGTGTLDDVHKLEAVYTPSERDIENGGCSLKLLAKAFPGCPNDSSFTSIMIEKLPEFETEAEKNSIGAAPVKLSLKLKTEGGIIAWSSSGSGLFADNTKTETTYQPSATDISKETISITASVSSNSGSCTAKKQVLVLISQKPSRE